MPAIDRATMRGILFTDQYQLTMGQLYYRLGLQELEVQFDHYFRRYPDYDQHSAGYCINAGLAWLLDWMQETHFRAKDLEYLRSHRNTGNPPPFASGSQTRLGRNSAFSPNRRKARQFRSEVSMSEFPKERTDDF